MGHRRKHVWGYTFKVSCNSYSLIRKRNHAQITNSWIKSDVVSPVAYLCNPKKPFEIWHLQFRNQQSGAETPIRLQLHQKLRHFKSLAILEIVDLSSIIRSTTVLGLFARILGFSRCHSDTSYRIVSRGLTF